MNKSTNIIVYLIFITLLLQSCSRTKANNDDLPGVQIEPNKINSDFVIFEDPVGGSANSHKNNEFLIVRVTNLVDSQIKFSAGFVKLFAMTDDKWKEVDNLMNRPDADVSLPTAKEFPPGMDVTVIPWIPDLTGPTKVRIFFEGLNVDTGEEVGAYTDFILLP